MDKFEAMLSDRSFLFKPARYIDALVAANSSPGLFRVSLGNKPSQEDPLGEGNDNPLQYSCLENPMDRGAWCATVHRIAKSWTLLK